MDIIYFGGSAALGPALVRDPGDFGPSYIIPTVYVPLLLVAHYYAMKVLSQRPSEKSVAIHEAAAA